LYFSLAFVIIVLYSIGLLLESEVHLVNDPGHSDVAGGIPSQSEGMLIIIRG
jgi:hypothetical protein